MLDLLRHEKHYKMNTDLNAFLWILPYSSVKERQQLYMWDRK
jgi:hypothetical protein